jgi:nitrate/nitrite transporter NarK
VCFLIIGSFQAIEDENSTANGGSSMFSRTFLRSLLIVNAFNFFLIMAGTFTIIFYAVNIMQQATGGHISDKHIAIVTALTRVILTGIACVLLLHVSSLKKNAYFMDSCIKFQ